jgi:NADPH:quinone reductase-like Zn-dependent oxidoreductase
MKAIAINQFNAPPGLIDVPDLQAGDNEVLVNVEYASVNGMDLMAWKGWIEGMIPYQFPITLGRDFSGTVAAVGSGVTGLKAGDPVFGLLMSYPVHAGTLAPQAKVPATSLVKRPDGLDAKTAGGLGLAGGAAKASIDTVAPARGETVLVSGATGGVGAFAMQMAKQRGAKVIATATPAHAGFVKDFGADEVVDYTKDLAAALRSSHPDGVDIVLHLAGDGPALAKLLKPGGRFASVLGVGPDKVGRTDVTAKMVMTIPAPAWLGELAASAASGQLRVPTTKVYKLDQAGQALNDFAAGSLGKLVIAVR